MRKIEIRINTSAFSVLLLIFFIIAMSPDAFAQMMEGGRHDRMHTTTLSIFETADFSGSGICASCHSSLKDSAGNDVSIDAHWRSTMMANAAKDPLWQAKLASEVTRNPSLQAVIEEKCSRCHTGMARYQAVTDGAPVKVLGDGFLNPDNSLHEAAMDGVSCTLCHQIQNIGLGTPGSYTGLYFIDTYTSPPDRVVFGPYDQPRNSPMEMHSGFSPDSGYHMADSALCGTCHTLYTPTVNAAGNVIGEFPEQTTYLEWRHSESRKTCRDCHLPEATGPAAISNRPRMLSARQSFREHHLAGGNSFMLMLLKNHASELGIAADTAQLDAGISRTDSVLKNAAGVTVSTASLKQGVLTVALDIQNLTGHKLPTGIPLRRAWLHLTVRDKTGRIIFESGKPKSDGGIAGNDADLGAGAYEPHYDLITAPDQVQIYESVMLDTDNAVTYTLLRANTYVKDNRLLPAGFDKTSAPADIGVRGSAAIDINFTGGLDRVTYQVDVSGARGPFAVTGELFYQSLSHPFIQDLIRDRTALVDRFSKMYETENKMPQLMTSIQVSVH